MKIKNQFLQKVMKLNTLDTQKFRYRVKNVTEPEYQYAIIERIPLESLPSTNKDWELVATTWNGKDFIRA